jgi:2-C-methyl-D-erythritol 4-phosphate cytidylyltransferase
MVDEYGWSKVIEVCPGGKRRQDSVKEGLNRLSDCHWVAIHDGARPCVSIKLIEDGLNTAHTSGSAIPAIPISDTVKSVDGCSFVEETLSREQLWSVQTPQIFRFDIISEAYAKVRNDVTDDASMVEAVGYKVKVFPGSTDNIKVTTPEDFIIAEAILTNRTPD